MPDTIHLLRAGIMESIILVARDMGIDTQPYEKAAGLPILAWGKENPDMAVSLSAAMDFLEIVSRREGLPLFGLDVAFRMAVEQIRSMHLHYQNCDNLYQVLSLFVARARMQSSIGDYHLELEDSMAWLVHKGVSPRKNFLQTDLFTVAAQIQIVRLVMGAQWLPQKIHLRVPVVPAVLEAPQLKSVEILFSQPYRATGFDQTLLANPVPWATASQEHEAFQEIDQLPQKKLSRQLEAILPSYLAVSNFNHGMLEKVVGMSFRSLQRKLAAEGESYSRILLRVKMNMARQLLEDTDTPLKEVAQQLGYCNAPNFIRAFRGWAGMTPAQYRRSFQH